MISAGLLLAAGQSRRFGPADKLLAPFDGAPLIAHAACALRDSGLHPLIAVISNPEVAKLLSGFDIIFLSNEPSAQSRSLAAGIAEVRRKKADRVTIALGDMPRVTPDLLRRIAEICPPGGASATTDGEHRMPPAAFDRAMFDALKTMKGDRGAEQLLRAIPDAYLLLAEEEQLLDLDTAADVSQNDTEAAKYRE